MFDHSIKLPSQPRVALEEGNKGIYEIDGLYPGYGHTIGNSLRRIILSSLPGYAVTSVKIDGVSHEFSSIDGVKEDVINLLLNLKFVRFAVTGDEAQIVTLSVKGPKIVTGKDIVCGGQVEVANPDQYICELTGKTNLSIEITIEKGLGFVSKEDHHKGKMDIGAIGLDAIFSPIRRVSYDVENMRVDDNTNFNRVRMTIETDGTISPREALESGVMIMIRQLEAVLNVKVVGEKSETTEVTPSEETTKEKVSETDAQELSDVLKTRIDTLDLTTRTLNALTNANIRTVGGIARKRAEDLLEIEGIGEKGIQEIKKALGDFNLSLKG